MSINLTDKLDEAIVEIEKIIRDKEKAKNSARAKNCWATSSKLQEKMSNETAQRYGIERNDTEQNITTTEVKPGWQSPNASWRSKLLTIRQINYLDKLDYTGPIPKLRGEASDIISSSPAALQLRYLQTLTNISAEKNSTIIFPLPIDLLQSMTAAAKTSM